MFNREFAAAEDDDGFQIFYPGEMEPFRVAKRGLDPSLAEQIRARVVPEDAPGHFAGGPMLLANAIPPGAVPTTEGETTGDGNFAPTGDPSIDELLYHRARVQQAFPAPSEPVVEQRDLGDAPPTDVAIPYVDMRAPTTLPEGFAPDPVIAPAPIPSFQDTLTVPQAPAGLSPFALSPMTETAAPTPRGPRELSESQIRSIRGGDGAGQAPADGVPPALARADGGSAGQRAGGGMSMSRSTRAPGETTGFNPTPLAADPEAEKRQIEAATIAGLAGDIEQRLADEKAQIAAKREAFLVTSQERLQQRLAERQRQAQQMREEILAQKVDPNRIYGNMSTGQRITTLVAMVLGGLGRAGAGGSNPVIDALDREVDRDIEIQKGEIGRRMTMYQSFLDEGNDEMEAWKLTRAASLDAIAAQLEATAARHGGEQAKLAAREAQLKLQEAAAKARADAEKAHYDRQLQTYDIASQAAAREAEAKAKAETVRLGWYEAKTRRDALHAGGEGATGKNPPMEIAPGVIVQPSDPTSRQNLEKAVVAFGKLRELVGRAKAHRAENDSAWFPFTEESANAEMLGSQLVTTLNDALALGAFDEGTKKLLEKIVPDIGAIFSSKAGVNAKLDGILRLAQEGFQTKIMANTVPGTGLTSFPSPGGASPQFRPVGKAE